MQNLKGKTMAILIAAILTVSIGASTTILQTASAHSPPWIITTYAYISVAPDPCGVGQSVDVSFWLDKPTPDTSGHFGDRWTGFTVTVTKPDGTTEALALG